MVKKAKPVEPEVFTNHGCAPAIWRKLTRPQQVMWSTVYLAMADQQTVHPAGPQLPPKEWDVVRHNAACYAAWAV